MTDERLDLEDLLDRLVAEYVDGIQRGETPDREALLQLVPEQNQATLLRCLKMAESGQFTPPTHPPPLLPGSTLGPYKLLKLVGRGGMAHIFLAHHPDLKRDVALKVMRSGLALELRHVDRFRREASAIARLSHPNIVQVHDVGSEHGVHYLAMEWIDGPNLDQVLHAMPEDRPWTGADLARAAGWNPTHESYERAYAALIAQAVRGVSAAHSAGIVHRDLKPSNILIHPDGRALVADFGLAKGDSDPGLSLTGEMLGTPHYMSPEQVAQSAAEVDERTDIYSLGVTLYEGLTGQRPHRGPTTLKVLESIQTQQPVPIRSVRPSLTANAEAVVDRAMAKDAQQRQASSEELLSDLDALAEGRVSRSLSMRAGGFRRGLRVAASALAGHAVEYRSPVRWLGLPLVHVRFAGRGHRGRIQPARGWLAIGSVAVGAIALGGTAIGGVALGVLAVGLASLGAACALGVLALGLGSGAGLVATGGMSAGFVAFGGMAAGQYVIAGKACAPHQISGLRIDQEAVELFDRFLPWLLDCLPADPRVERCVVSQGNSKEQEMLKTLLATFAWIGTPPTDAAVWEHFSLPNGIQVSSLVVEDAESQSFFTLLPLGLLADDAHRAQYAHLVEHMLIRSTDPDGLEVDGIRLNGETSALTLRLESIGPVERWRESLERHARWVAADSFDEQVLAVEQQRIGQEEAGTTASGFTAKWADAAWNQVIRHGLTHAAVHNDPASATVDDLREYVRRRVPVSDDLRFVSVGPVATEELRGLLEATLGRLEPQNAEPRESTFDGSPMHREATWDLDARHYIEWYPLPDRGPADRVGSVVLSQLVMVALSQDADLQAHGIRALAGADLVTPEGRFLKLTVGFQEESDLELIQQAFRSATEHPLELLQVSGDAQATLAQLIDQLSVLPDFGQLRKLVAGRPMSKFLEAQVALTQMNHRITTGLLADAELKQGHAAVTPELVAELARLAFREDARSSLLLRPVR